MARRTRMALKVIALIAVCMSAAIGEDTESDRKLDAILAELKGIRVLLQQSNGFRERRGRLSPVLCP